MKNIAILTPVHRRPDLIADQIKNYWKFHAESAFHILHPSIEGRRDLKDLYEYLAELAPLVHLNPDSLQTSWKCILGAFVSNTRFLKTNFNSVTSYVYIHTDADLLLNGNLVAEIESNKVGFTADPINKNWHWNKFMDIDTRFQAVKKFLNINDKNVVGGRQEGAYFPYELWLEVTAIIEKFYDDGFYSETQNHWPLEEVLIPTIIKALHPEIKPKKIIVKTKPAKIFGSSNPRDVDDNCVSIEDIKKMEETVDGCFGLKWFSQNFDDPARLFVRNLAVV